MTILRCLQVMHSDVKSHNVLLNSELTVAKICDVGLARILDGRHYRDSGEYAWTFAYAAPEQLLGQDVTIQADMYSFGVVRSNTSSACQGHVLLACILRFGWSCALT